MRRQSFWIVSICIVSTLFSSQASAWYNPQQGRFLQKDSNETGSPLISSESYHGQTPIIPVVRPNIDIHYGDGLNLYQYLASDPANRVDPLGTFSYVEVMGTQSLVGGLVGGIVSSATGNDFWTGAFGGAISGGLGGAAGAFANSAFAASASGFLGTLVAHMGVGAVDGFVSGYAESVYLNGNNFAANIADAAFGGAVGVATGGMVDVGGRLARKARRALGWMPSCFVEGTPVWMADGTFKPIEEVEIGEMVKCDFDPELDNGPESCLVLNTFEREASEVVILEFEGSGESQTTIATPEHPFYVPEDQTYVVAADLVAGMQVRSYSGIPVCLEAKTRQSKPVRVYNFEVEKAHNYHVGALGLLVHNTCTRAQIRDLAKQWGLKGPKVHPKLGRKSHGEEWFTDGTLWYTFDNTSHRDGIWKIFDRTGSRMHTIDANGNIVGK